MKKHTITIKWPNALPINETEQRQVAQLDLTMEVVSRETIARKLGYSPEREFPKIQSEQAQNDARQMKLSKAAKQPSPQEGNTNV